MHSGRPSATMRSSLPWACSRSSTCLCSMTCGRCFATFNVLTPRARVGASRTSSSIRLLALLATPAVAREALKLLTDHRPTIRIRHELHHPPRDRRHFRRRRLDPLAGFADGHGCPRARGQRVRRGGGRRLRAAGGRAAPERTRRRGADPALGRGASAACVSICGQGVAPAAATVDAFRRMGLEQVPGIGLLPATVPGAFGAWLTMLRDHGTWSLADVLAPAIGYARDGFPLIPRAVQAITAVQDLFRKHWPSSAAVWLPDGRVPRAGRAVPAAATGRDLGAHRPRRASARAAAASRSIDAALRCWYQGFVAREIDATTATEEVQRHHAARSTTGLLRYDDMARGQPTVEAPLSRGLRPLHRRQMRLLEPGAGVPAADRHAAPRGPGAHAPDTAGFVHRIAEAAKLALADRLAWYGAAPGASRDAQSALLADEYLRAALGASVGAARNAEPRPGRAAGRRAALPDLDAARRTLLTADTPLRRRRAHLRRAAAGAPNGRSAKSSSATPATST